ncbi:MAG TPA: LCP family protein [Candidatus Dormibacteraeota bacterium]|nr:LCP family protein [Candidatus Dormibacteraeota bacterium]
MGKHLEPPAPRRARTSPPKLRSLLPAIVVLVAALAGFLVFNHRAITDAVTRVFIPSPESLFGKSRIYLLVLGTDDNWTDTDQLYTKNDRSDTIMAVALDFPSHVVSVISVPRDMWLRLPGGYHGKINAAFADGGVKESEAVIARFLGLPSFDRYVVLKINATKELVDAIGGIDVCVDETMNYDDNWGHLHIHLKKGCQHLDGQQAVGYSRFRHDALGDIGRIQRQQQVVRAVIAKLKNDKFNDLTHIVQLIDVARRNVQTNLTFDEMRSLAFAFRDVNLAGIKTAQLPYLDAVDEPDGENALEPDPAGIDRMVAKYLTGPLAAPPTPNPALAANVAPGSVHVDVENGTAQAGMAQTVADRLKAKGFVIDAIGNADRSDYASTLIRADAANQAGAEAVRQALAVSTATIALASSADATAPAVTVVVGQDIAGVR